MPDQGRTATPTLTLVVAVFCALLGGVLGWGGTVLQFQGEMVTREEALEIAKHAQIYPQDRKFLLEAVERHAKNIEELRTDFNRLLQRLAD